MNNDALKISNLYDLNETIAAKVFEDCTYPWEVLAKIGDFIVDLAKKGAAVILVSSDLNELVQLAHRIIIMRRGRFVGEVEKDEFDVRKILSVSSSQEKEEEVI